eukprot:1733377-Rhodomonas_salina.1
MDVGRWELREWVGGGEEQEERAATPYDAVPAYATLAAALAADTACAADTGRIRGGYGGGGPAGVYVGVRFPTSEGSEGGVGVSQQTCLLAKEDKEGAKKGASAIEIRASPGTTRSRSSLAAGRCGA